jgi:hypothetical protein
MSELVATVTEILGDRVIVKCPRCGGLHQHLLVQKGHREHRALGCSIHEAINRSERVAGYFFDVPTMKPTKERSK